eukprot:4714410-Amphidinium_carterae.1
MMQPMRDPFHRFWNDVSAALIGARCYSHYCQSLVHLNIGFGPWSQSAFWEEIQGAARIASQGLSPNDALLCSVWPKIVQDGLQIETEFGTHVMEETAESRALWLKHLSSLQFLRSKGQKASASRWFSWVESFSALDTEFHSKALVLALICMNKGFVRDFASLLDDSDMTKRKKSSGGVDAEERAAGESSVGTASSSNPTKGSEFMKAKQDLQQLRQRCSNSLHIAAKLMWNAECLTVCRLMHLVTRPLHFEYAEMVRTLRGDSGCHALYLSWSLGSWSDSLRQSIAVLTNTPSLHRVGLKCSAADASQLSLQDSFACTLVALVGQVLAKRCTSMMQHSGFPLRMALCLGTDADRANCMASLRRAARAFLEAQHCTMKEVTEARQHSPFLDPFMSVVLLTACKSGFAAFSDECLRLIQSVFGAWGQSRIIEDVNGRLRDLEC